MLTEIGFTEIGTGDPLWSISVLQNRNLVHLNQLASFH